MFPCDHRPADALGHAVPRLVRYENVARPQAGPFAANGFRTHAGAGAPGGGCSRVL
jgi:hypothetical protein